VAVLRQFLATTAPASYTSDDWRALLRRGRPTAPEPAAPIAAQEAPLAAS
jgi:hypothetical protein